MFPRGVTTTAAGGRLLAGLLLSAALLSGCSSLIHGKPVASSGTGPTEPSFPTRSRQYRRRPRRGPPRRAPTRRPAHPAASRPNGHVFIETKSGQTRCQINNDSVGCEAPFTNSPLQDGEHANGVNVTASGDVQWVLGNLGDIPTVTIDYKTYDAAGWTIAPPRTAPGSPTTTPATACSSASRRSTPSECITALPCSVPSPTTSTPKAVQARDLTDPCMSPQSNGSTAVHVTRWQAAAGLAMALLAGLLTPTAAADEKVGLGGGAASSLTEATAP